MSHRKLEHRFEISHIPTRNFAQDFGEKLFKQ
jgi:hypothetical protein